MDSAYQDEVSLTSLTKYCKDGRTPIMSRFRGHKLKSVVNLRKFQQQVQSTLDPPRSVINTKDKLFLASSSRDEDDYDGADSEQELMLPLAI